MHGVCDICSYIEDDCIYIKSNKLYVCKSCKTEYNRRISLKKGRGKSLLVISEMQRDLRDKRSRELGRLWQIDKKDK